MKFKTKLLAVALALAAASGANAATINNGSGGNGGLFFNIWDATGSYTRNLGTDLISFETLVAGGAANLSYAADTTLTGWITGKSSFNWNIMAVDFQGAKRVLQTANSAATLTAKATNVVTTASSQTNALVTAINSKLASANSATYTTADTGYVGKAAGGVTTINANIGWTTAALGTQANTSFASGLVLKEALANASGTLVVPILAMNASTHAYFDAANTLHIEAVQVPAIPEPETYALMLAGLGMLGFMARRRLSNNA